MDGYDQPAGSYDRVGSGTSTLNRTESPWSSIQLDPQVGIPETAISWEKKN